MKTFEEWVEKANKIFNNKYEYITQYKKDKYQFLEIKCKDHGIFHKKVQNHILKEQGCPQCTKPSKLTNEIFINRSKEIHKDIFDYSLVEYKTQNTKVKIKCKENHIFEQTPKNHMNGQGCPSCFKIDGTLFIKKAKEIHGEKYNYDKVKYVSKAFEIIITCNEHGDFEQTPSSHLRGRGCYKCSNLIRNTKDFVEKASKIHNNIYDYSKVNYENAKNKITITCKIHGDFKQSPNDHISGCGCRKCNLYGSSKIAIEWLESIMKKENIFIQHANNIGEKQVIINDKTYKFDGYCEKTNTVYEFHGSYYHGDPKFYNKNDFNVISKKTFGELYLETMNREKNITKVGYNLITVWENDYWKDLKTQNI